MEQKFETELMELMKMAKEIGMSPVITIYSDFNGTIKDFNYLKYEERFFGLGDCIHHLAHAIASHENRVMKVDGILGKLKNILK